MTKTIEEVKKGLELCSPDGRCQYSTNPDCPYRITEIVCERSKLMLDAKEFIEFTENNWMDASRKLEEVRKIIGPDCDNCDRW